MGWVTAVFKTCDWLSGFRSSVYAWWSILCLVWIPLSAFMVAYLSEFDWCFGGCYFYKRELEGVPGAWGIPFYKVGYTFLVFWHIPTFFLMPSNNPVFVSWMWLCLPKGPLWWFWIISWESTWAVPPGTLISSDCWECTPWSEVYFSMKYMLIQHLIKVLCCQAENRAQWVSVVT